MRKPELAEAISGKAGLTKEKSSEVINAFIDVVSDALADDESVTIVGFGTFLQRHRKAKTGKHPQTGVPIDIPASNTAAFRPGKTLKEQVNSGE